MCSARSRPTAKEHINAYGKINQADQSQPQRQIPVHRLRNHLDNQLRLPARRDAVAADAIVNLEVAAGAIERALQVRRSYNRGELDVGGQDERFIAGVLAGLLRQFLHARQRLTRPDSVWQTRTNGADRQDTHSRQPVARTDARPQTRTVRQHSVGHQAFAIGRLAPPDAVVRLLRVALLEKVQHRQQHQPGRDQAQQRQLQAVEDTCLHQESTLHLYVLLHVGCHG